VREFSLSLLVTVPENADGKTLLAMAESHLDKIDTTFAAESVPSTPPEALDSEPPSSFANGRYEVKTLLGEGGKKNVYFAHGIDLALATIRVGSWKLHTVTATHLSWSYTSSKPAPTNSPTWQICWGTRRNQV
jgi:hypothetical protein